MGSVLPAGTTLQMAPLRRVVERFGQAVESRDGLIVHVSRERLECGHVVRPKSDIYGETAAVRRRCRECSPALR